MSLRMSYQPPRILLPGIQPGWAMSIPPEWLARDNPEPNPITIKPKTVSHVAEQFSCVPLPCCSPPGCPFPIKSLALSARVSPRTIHFRVLDKRPLSGPGKDPPSCNTTTSWDFSPWRKAEFLDINFKCQMHNILKFLNIPYRILFL